MSLARDGTRTAWELHTLSDLGRIRTIVELTPTTKTGGTTQVRRGQRRNSPPSPSPDTSTGLELHHPPHMKEIKGEQGKGNISPP